MTPSDIRVSILINVVTGASFFLLGLLWPRLRYANKPFVRWFFGKGVFANFRIAHGSIIDSRASTAKPSDVRFLKRFHDGRLIGLPGPWENVIGDCEIRASSYLINALDRYRGSPLDVLDDFTAFANLDSSFVSLGSPSSNELSDFVIRQPENRFLEFGQDAQGAFIRGKNHSQLFRGFEHRDGKDIGIVLKIPNSRFPGHYFFVCAGLGEWGTSGAAWYLSQNWRRLPWSRAGFGVIVEVDQTSDTSVREIFRACR